MNAVPRLLPFLDALADNPGAALEITDAATIEALLVKGHAAVNVLLGRLLALRAAPPPPSGCSSDDGVVDIDEAALILAMKKSTLYKRWRTLGIGFKDVDGHPKFQRAALHKYLRRKGG